MLDRLLSKLSKVNLLIHSLSSFSLSIVYTIGHIFIAWLCATLIFDANFIMASADAIIEPVINGFWFFILHKLASKKLRPSILAIVYTIGHFLIATTWSTVFLGVSMSLAALDAIIEPLLNGFWFYALVYKKNFKIRNNLNYS